MHISNICFEKIELSSYFNYNKAVLKLLSTFYYYPKMCLLNKRDGKEEAEYNEVAEAGINKDFSLQILHLVIRKKYKE